jgi:hypothetical protein
MEVFYQKIMHLLKQKTSKLSMVRSTHVKGLFSYFLNYMDYIILKNKLQGLVRINSY